MHGYELIAGASDPDHPDHARLADEFADMYGGDVHPADFALVPFGLDAVNAELDGITLTAAGCLPPVHVRAAVDELGLGETWIGAGNRENQTVPVLDLRESAQELGLLRKHRGRLLTTARGRAIIGDPVALWRHLAERMPLGSRDEAVRQGGLVLLLAVTAVSTDELATLAADVLTARGWRLDGRRPLDASTARRILWDNVAMLRRIGALTDTPQSRWPGQATPEGVAFARAALAS